MLAARPIWPFKANLAVRLISTERDLGAGRLRRSGGMIIVIVIVIIVISILVIII